MAYLFGLLCMTGRIWILLCTVAWPKPIHRRQLELYFLDS